MPQQPTGVTPVEILKEYKGLNDQSDSLKRPPGTITEGRNLFDSQYGDANRRQGRDLQSLDPDGNPISVIYNLTWADGSATSITQAGGNFQYSPFYYPSSSTVGDLLVDPCPDGEESPVDPTTGLPLCPAPSPSGGLRMPPTPGSVVTLVPDLVPIMRAMAEAWYFSQRSSQVGLNFPTQSVAVDFYDNDNNLVASGIRDRDNFEGNVAKGYHYRISSTAPVSPPTPLTDIPLDFYYVDYVVRGGPRYVSDLNVLIGLYNGTILVTYLKTDPASTPTDLTNYSVSDYYEATVSEMNFQQTCSTLSNLINNVTLKNVKVAGTQGSFETKSATAQDGGGSCPASYTVTATFDASSCPDDDCTNSFGFPPWPGSAIATLTLETPELCSYSTDAYCSGVHIIYAILDVNRANGNTSCLFAADFSANEAWCGDSVGSPIGTYAPLGGTGNCPVTGAACVHPTVTVS